MVYDYAGKADLSKSLWVPKVKLGKPKHSIGGVLPNTGMRAAKGYTVFELFWSATLRKETDS